tara:strand:- start:1247 stop:1603 length:357 start_codon:yes stop_codon:yes gene_type:complete
MRTKGAKTNKNCWKILIKQGDYILCDKEYKTLREASVDLGLTYSQICELGPNGRCKKKSLNFKFMPSISITKINPDSIEDLNIPEPILDIFNSETIGEAIDKVENKYKGINIENIGAI